MYEYNNFLYSSYSRFLSWTFIHPKSKEANKYEYDSLNFFLKTLAYEKVTCSQRKKSVGFFNLNIHVY